MIQTEHGTGYSNLVVECGVLAGGEVLLEIRCCVNMFNTGTQLPNLRASSVFK
jgi:hypothetical protein